MRMAAYCRVSTEKEEQLSSLKNQRDFFEQYAEKTGDSLVEIYADEGISGKSMRKRTAFTELLKDSQTDKFDYVAVKDISRFARNTSDFLYGIRTLRANGKDVRFLSGNQTVIGESEFVLTVFAALAQEESANLSKRVIFGKNQSAKKGVVPNVIYGYDKEDTYNLKINREESDAVKFMFERYISGDGTRRIAQWLNVMKIPTKKGAKWESKTVQRILKNPIYTGKMINHKSVTKDFLYGTRKPVPEEDRYIHVRPELRIISDKDFETVRKNMEERGKKTHYSGKYLYSGIVKCGVCGGNFTAKKQKNGSVIYRCGLHNNKGNEYCTNKVTVDEQRIFDDIKPYLKKFEKTSQNDDILRFNDMKNKLIRRKNKIKEMYIANVISAEELEKEISAADNGIKSIDEETEKLNRPKETDGGMYDYTNSDMRYIAEKIVVFPDKTVKVFMR